jgi:hypothetical protein
MGMVYMAINRVNGQSYVGLTLRNVLSNRQAEHLQTALEGRGYSFHQAIREYGWPSFSWHILYTSEDPNKLALAEMAFIRKYATRYPNGYNHTDGGELPSYIQPVVPKQGWLVNLLKDCVYAVREAHRQHRRTFGIRKRVDTPR